MADAVVVAPAGLRKFTLWPLAALAGWAALALGPLTLHPTWVAFPPNSPYTDLLLSHLPNALYLRDSLARFGQWPLWNAQILAGQPFAADPLSGMWYPPNLLLLLLPVTAAVNMLVGLHLTGAGYGVYRLLRAEGVGRWAALLGGAAFAGTPKLLAHFGAGHVSLIFAVAWTPWLVLAARRAALGGWRRGAAAGAVLALICLADVRWVAYSAPLAVAAAVLEWFRRRGEANAAGGAAGFGGRGQGEAFAAGKAASSEIRGRMLRPYLLAGVSAGVHFALLSAVFVLPFEEFVRLSNRAALTLAEASEFSLPPRYLIGLSIPNLGGFHEWMTYLGVVPLVLGLGGVGRGRWLWAAAALAAGAFALGNNFFVFPALFRFVPGVSGLRVPPRVWFLVALAVAMLAGHGAQRLADAGLPWLARRYPALGPRLPRAHVLLAALVVLTAADLWRVNWTLFAARPAPELTEAAAWLREQPGQFRVYSPDYALPYGDGLEHLDGVNPLQLAAPQAAIAAAVGVGGAGYSVVVPANVAEAARGETVATPDAAGLGLFNVKYVVSRFPLSAPGLALAHETGGALIYRNDVARERVWMEPAGGAARVRAWSPNRIEVEAVGPGTLVLSEIAYPGWEVKVDGEQVPLMEAGEGILRAVAVPEGTHTVVFDFRPRRVYAGLLLSGLGLAALAGGWWYGARRKTRAEG